MQVADEAGLEVSAQLAAVPSATIGESLVGSLHFTNGLQNLQYMNKNKMYCKNDRSTFEQK